MTLLFKNLSEQALLRSLTLNHTHVDEVAMRDLARFLNEEGYRLKELDLSSCPSNSKYYLHVLEALSRHQNLTYVGLSFNSLFIKEHEVDPNSINEPIDDKESSGS